MTIQEKAAALVDLRSRIDEIKKTKLEPLQAQRDELQEDLIQHMTRSGFLSVKTGEATVSKSISRKLAIIDKKATISYLQSQGLTDYVVPDLNKDLWAPFERELLKAEKKIPGTEIIKTEYISVRKAVKRIKEGGGDDE